jgi:hypothetical protein
VRAGSKVAEVIRRDDLDVGAAARVDGPPEVPPDPPEPVDSYPDTHWSALLFPLSTAKSPIEPY